MFYMYLYKCIQVSVYLYVLYVPVRVYVGSYDSLATLVTAETRTVVCAYLDLYVLVCMFMLSCLMSHMYVLVYVGSSDADTAETRMGICVHVCVYARGCICLCSHVACLYGVVHV